MFNALLPKGAPFLELLLQQNQFLCDASAELANIFENKSDEEKLRREISELEAAADKIHLVITRHLSRAFITPIDREDILHINNAQEEAIDLYNNLIARFHFMELISVPSSMLRLARTLNQMAVLTRSMIEGLSKKEDSHNTRAFLALRDESENMLRTGIKELFDAEKIEVETLLSIVKWTRAYDRMEQIVDQMVRLFEAIEEAVLKHV